MVGDEESEDDDSAYRQTRRCVSRRKVCYKEDSASDTDDSGPTSRKTKKSPLSKRKRVIINDSDEQSVEETKSQPKRKSGKHIYSDSEYSPNDDSDDNPKDQKSSRKVNYRDMLGSDSEEEEEAEPAKKKKDGPLNVNDFLKSSSDGTITDNGSDDGSQNEVKNVKVNGEDSHTAVTSKKVNGLPADVSGTKAAGARNTTKVASDTGGEANSDDDLDDVEDLVNYVTQEWIMQLILRWDILPPGLFGVHCA